MIFFHQLFIRCNHHNFVRMNVKRINLYIYIHSTRAHSKLWLEKRFHRQHREEKTFPSTFLFVPWTCNGTELKWRVRGNGRVYDDLYLARMAVSWRNLSRASLEVPRRILLLAMANVILNKVESFDLYCNLVSQNE